MANTDGYVTDLEDQIEQLTGELEDADKQIQRLEKTLTIISEMPDEENEWDAVDKYQDARTTAQKALDVHDGTCEHGVMGGDCNVCNPDLFKDIKT